MPVPRFYSRLKGIAWLLSKGLARLLVARLRGGKTLWWRYKFNRLAFGRGLLLENVCGADESTRPMRALLCYLVAPFLLDPDSPQILKHGNRWRGLEIARMLDELGFVVDVVDHDDAKTRVADRYDLLLGQGRRAHALAREFGSRARKVFLATSPDPQLRHGCVRARISKVNEERGCEIRETRAGDAYPTEALRGYDALVCLGGEESTKRFRRYFDGPIYTWHNHADERFIGQPPDKDFEKASRRFLFFGTRDQILCGLDLALEVFKRRPHLELYVCGPFAREERFVACFRRELYETPNVHPVGWVEVGGERFTDLTRRCGFVIAPMCPTSSHGSLVICAGAGLVPLATAYAAGVDTDRLGTTLPSLDREEIGRVVDEVTARPAAWLRETSAELVEIVRRDFSQAAFTRRFRPILEEVVHS